MTWLKRLPVPLQILLIVCLFYLTWHFRYYTDGVDEAELTKIKGIHYNPNPWCLAFFFIALALIESLRERLFDYRSKKRQQAMPENNHFNN